MGIGATASDAGTAGRRLARLMELGEDSDSPENLGDELGMSALIFVPRNGANNK
jgi:hypothetical protein